MTFDFNTLSSGKYEKVTDSLSTLLESDSLLYLPAITLIVFIKDFSDNLEITQNKGGYFYALCNVKERTSSVLLHVAEEIKTKTTIVDVSFIDRLIELASNADEMLIQTGNYSRKLSQLVQYFSQFDLNLTSDRRAQHFQRLLEEVNRLISQSHQEVSFVPAGLARFISKLIDLQEHEVLFDRSSGDGSSLSQIALEQNAFSKLKNIVVNKNDIRLTLYSKVILQLIMQSKAILFEHKEVYDNTFGAYDVQLQLNFQTNINLDNNLLGKAIPENESTLNSIKKNELLWFESVLMRTMKPNGGRILIQLPYGCMFKSGDYAKSRQFLIANNLVDAVIELPTKQRYGRVLPIVLMLLRNDKKTDDVIFIRISKEIITSKTGRFSSLGVLDQAYESFRLRKPEGGVSVVVKNQDILNSGGELSVNKYMPLNQSSDVKNLNDLLIEREQLVEELVSTLRIKNQNGL